MRHLSPYALLAPLAALALAATATAQRPATWQDLAVPGGIDPARLDSRGKIVLYRDGLDLRVFGAQHRRWQSLTAGPNAAYRLMNDCLLVQDGATWTAFSSYTGRFAPLAVSAAAVLVNPASQVNDSILLVVDGNTSHAFSCFTGAWVPRSVSSSTGFAVGRHVALAADGNQLSGFDAFSGQWHDVTVANAPLALDCDGSVGLAFDAQEVHGFSALHRTWQTHALPAGALLARDDDWALFYSGAEMLGYSGIRAGFASLPLGASAVPHRADLFALAATAAGFVAFSAPRGTFTTTGAATTAVTRTGAATAVFSDGALVIGYSAALATSASIQVASAGETVASAVATAVDLGTGLPHVYSSLLGSWYQVPAGVPPQSPLTTSNCVLLAAANGAYAFSARTGAFVPLPGAGLVLVGNDQSAVAAAWDATHLHAFDTRTDTWRSKPRTSAGPPTVQIWRTAMYAIDGATAHGFGTQAGVWDSLSLPEIYANGRANSESSRVVTATHVFAHAAVPGTLPSAQFPEFRRVQPRGADARFTVALAGGGIAVLAGGFFTATATPIAGLGELRISAPLATLLLVAPGGSELATAALALPNDPALAGLELGFQALAVPAAGAAYLDDAVGLYVL
ncbi:MAG: hypothetical protein KDE27_32065 [Planctomycetes bacterium]|nr:hypothetical protein [Planctomycetota bacterium]